MNGASRDLRIVRAEFLAALNAPVNGPAPLPGWAGHLDADLAIRRDGQNRAGIHYLEDLTGYRLSGRRTAPGIEAAWACLMSARIEGLPPAEWLPWFITAWAKRTRRLEGDYWRAGGGRERSREFTLRGDDPDLSLDAILEHLVSLSDDPPWTIRRGSDGRAAAPRQVGIGAGGGGHAREHDSQKFTKPGRYVKNWAESDANGCLLWTADGWYARHTFDPLEVAAQSAHLTRDERELLDRIQRGQHWQDAAVAMGRSPRKIYRKLVKKLRTRGAANWGFVAVRKGSAFLVSELSDEKER